LTAPRGPDRVELKLELARDHLWLNDRRPLVLFEGSIPVRGDR
jgi:hypothetical protein